MSVTDEIKAWLPWVIKIRFVIIIFVFAIDYSLLQLTNPGGGLHSLSWDDGYFVADPESLLSDLQSAQPGLPPSGLSSNFLRYRHYHGHCPLTGDLESNFFSLYLVTIILASVLFPRGRAFLIAAVSFVMMGGMIELVYLPGLFPGLVKQFPVLQVHGNQRHADPGVDDGPAG